MTSTCLVVMLESLEEGVQGTMRKLCQGRKKCLAVSVISKAWIVSIFFLLFLIFFVFGGGLESGFCLLNFTGKYCVEDYMKSNQEENIHRDPPAEELAAEQKFSLQTAWLVVKILPRGYMVRLACSGRSKVWLEYGENVGGTKVRTTHDLDKQIFEGQLEHSQWKEEKFKLTF